MNIVEVDTFDKHKNISTATMFIYVELQFLHVVCIFVTFVLYFNSCWYRVSCSSTVLYILLHDHFNVVLLHVS